jgi:hypothetical protein
MDRDFAGENERPGIQHLLTYDDRLAKAAADAGMPVLAPHDS